MAAASKAVQFKDSSSQSLDELLQSADSLHQQNKIAESVNAYYKASLLSASQNDLPTLKLCNEKIRIIDPTMEHLDASQKMQLVAQGKILRTKAPSLEENKVPIPACAFGKAEWMKYFGVDTGVEPPLPHDIDKILKSPCPFWEGDKIEETQLLVFIPKIVDGKPLTLRHLGWLVQHPKQGPATKFRFLLKGPHCDISPKEDSWVFMTRDIVPKGCRRVVGKTYDEYVDFIAAYNRKTKISYRPLGVLAAAVGIFTEYVRTGRRLYSDENPATVALCQEMLPNGDRLAIGGFSAKGLWVDEYDDDVGDYAGTGCLGILK